MSECEPINPINLGRGKRKKAAKKLFSSFSNYDGNESPVASTDGSNIQKCMFLVFILKN